MESLAVNEYVCLQNPPDLRHLHASSCRLLSCSSVCTNPWTGSAGKWNAEGRAPSLRHSPVQMWPRCSQPQGGERVLHCLAFSVEVYQLGALHSQMANFSPSPKEEEMSYSRWQREAELRHLRPSFEWESTLPTLTSFSLFLRPLSIMTAPGEDLKYWLDQVLYLFFPPHLGFLIS